MMVDDILRIDREQVRFRRAASGLVAMLAVVLFIGVGEDFVIAALMATLFVTAAGGDGTLAERLPGMVRFTILGSVLGGLAYWSADDAVVVALVVGLATYLGTLAAAAGPTAERAGLYLTIWPLLALMMGSADTEPWIVTVAFLAGGALSIAVTAVRLHFAGRDEPRQIDEPDEQDMVAGEPLTRPGQLAAAVASPIGLFALLRAVAVAVGVVLGFWWFSSYPLWVAITVIVVVRPSSSQSVSMAVQRTLGTAIGVAIAVLLAQVFPRTDVAVAIALLVSAFFMIAFHNANYTLFAAFLTATLVFAQRLVQADAFEAGWERLLATAVGALIAFAVTAITLPIQRRQDDQSRARP